MPHTLRAQSHIVVVDPAPTAYRGLVSLAEDHHWHLHFLTTAGAALRFVGRMPVDLWMIHVSLPDMSGFDLYEILRARAVQSAAFIISDQYDAAHERRACALGAPLYLCKDAAHSLDCSALLKELTDSTTAQLQTH